MATPLYKIVTVRWVEEGRVTTDAGFPPLPERAAKEKLKVLNRDGGTLYAIEPVAPKKR